MQHILKDGVLEAPIIHVLPEWIDPNGHMNMAFYLYAFDTAGDMTSRHLGLGWTYTQQGKGTMFSLESRIRYLREVNVGDPLRITNRVLDHDQKFLHSFMAMYHAEKGFLAATLESLAMHVSLETRRGAPFPPDRYEVIRKVHEAQRHLPLPEGVGQPVGIRRTAGAA